MLAVSSLALAGCEGKGAGISQRIEAADSPLIAEVEYAPQNIAGGIEHMNIYLIPDATDAQIVEAWCQVIVPAGIDELPVDRVGLRRVGTLEPEQRGVGVEQAGEAGVSAGGLTGRELMPSVVVP